MAEIEITVECEKCGRELAAETEIRGGRLILNVEACENCLEEIEKEAREEGDTEGYDRGHQDGKDAGYETGYREGKEEGYKEGLKEGETNKE